MIGIIDIIVIVIVGLCALRGWMRGVLVGILSLASLIIAWAASAPLAPRLATLIAQDGNVTIGWSYALARLGAGLLIFISVRVCGALVERRLGRDEKGEVRSWNRRAGLMTGLVVGLLVGACIVFAVDCHVKARRGREGDFVAEEEGGPHEGAFARAERTSLLRGLVTNHNPLDQFMVDTLVRLLPYWRDEKVRERLREDERVQRVMEHRAIVNVLNDADLRTAIDEKRVSDILKNENVTALLKSKELREQLFSDEMEAALTEAAEWAEKNRPRPGEPDEDEDGDEDGADADGDEG